MAATSQSLLFPTPASLSRSCYSSVHRAVACHHRPPLPAVAAAATPMVSSQSEEKEESNPSGGRFEQNVTDAIERFKGRFKDPISYDWQLYKNDLKSSKAHVSILAAQDLTAAGDRDFALEYLAQFGKQVQDDKFECRNDREDVHMNIEAALIEKVGEPAKKLLTAVSHNDKFITDFIRLCCWGTTDKKLIPIKQFQVSPILLASKYDDLIGPRYTHLQRAQPVSLPQLLLSLVEQGLITTCDRSIILEVLDQIGKQIQHGKFEWRKDREDVHRSTEAPLVEKVVELAMKLHTAKSHNGQIVTDVRLWCWDAIDKILIGINQFQEDASIMDEKEDASITDEKEDASITDEKEDASITDEKEDASITEEKEDAVITNKKIEPSKSANITHLLFLFCLLKYAESKGVLALICTKLSLPSMVAAAIPFLIKAVEVLYHALKESKEMKKCWMELINAPGYVQNNGTGK